MVFRVVTVVMYVWLPAYWPLLTVIKGQQIYLISQSKWKHWIKQLVFISLSVSVTIAHHHTDNMADNLDMANRDPNSLNDHVKVCIGVK